MKSNSEGPRVGWWIVAGAAGLAVVGVCGGVFGGDPPAAPTRTAKAHKPKVVRVAPRRSAAALEDLSVSAPLISAPPPTAGRSFDLRLSAPPELVTVERSASRLIVHVYGAQIRDAAAPIARRHPLIQGSGAYARDGRSELVLRFTPGGVPPYRVSLAGAQLTIEIDTELP